MILKLQKYYLILMHTNLDMYMKDQHHNRLKLIVLVILLVVLTLLTGSPSIMVKEIRFTTFQELFSSQDSSNLQDNQQLLLITSSNHKVISVLLIVTYMKQVLQKMKFLLSTHLFMEYYNLRMLLTLDQRQIMMQLLLDSKMYLHQKLQLVNLLVLVLQLLLLLLQILIQNIHSHSVRFNTQIVLMESFSIRRVSFSLRKVTLLLTHQNLIQQMMLYHYSMFIFLLILQQVRM